MRIPLFLASAVLAAIPSLSAAETQYHSGPGRVALIELYTSEGCSSCPPAEAWLDGLGARPELWRDFVPIAFHVNYWDNLGWPDRFASREFTLRQYAHASAWGTTSVYTPCFVRDGAEWHPADAGPGSTASRPGTLTAILLPGGRCRVEFVPAGASPADGLVAHVALLGSGFTSRVTAGENRGRTLTHQFVALALTTAPTAPGPAGATVELPLPSGNTAGSTRQAIAIWVTRGDDLTPLQATGGWLP